MTAPSDAERVRMLLAHAEASQLPSLRALCKAWLYADERSEGKRLAQQKLRAWFEQGDPSKDAQI